MPLEISLKFLVIIILAAIFFVIALSIIFYLLSGKSVMDFVRDMCLLVIGKIFPQPYICEVLVK